MATHRPEEAVSPVDLGRPALAVTIRTADRLDLDGRYIPSRNGAAVIVFPGSGSRVPQARALVRHGYGVLMLDMRGYAGSDGDPNMFGWGAAKDIDAGVAFLDDAGGRPWRADRGPRLFGRRRVDARGGGRERTPARRRRRRRR